MHNAFGRACGTGRKEKRGGRFGRRPWRKGTRVRFQERVNVLARYFERNFGIREIQRHGHSAGS
jgi:hypothetical protein